MKTWADFNLDFPDSFTGEMYSTCPECSAKRKKEDVQCLAANGDKLVWICHHCGFHGSLNDGTYHKADPLKWKTNVYYAPNYVDIGVGQSVYEWFKGRGISEETVKDNKIGFGMAYFPQISQQAPAIMFPFYRDGKCINIKYRATTGKMFRLETNAERIFYGMDSIKGETVAVVEGEIDKLSIQEAGYRDVVSVPDGAPTEKSKDLTEKFSFLEGAEEWLKGKKFVIAVDNDGPGRKLESELVRRLGAYRCKQIMWPDGCKDANDVLMKQGPSILRQVILKARDYPVEGVFRVSDLVQQVFTLYDSGSPRGESTGWDEVDWKYTVRCGEFTVLTGIPGHGKSEWLDALMVNMMSSCGWRFAIFSPENQPLERHIVKLTEKIVRKPFFKGVHERMSKDDLSTAMKLLEGYFSFILPPEDKTTIDGILELAQVEILRKGCKGIVIDPWNEIDHKRPTNMTETEYISSTLSKLRRFARQHAIHLWIVAHPTKMPIDPKTGAFQVPNPYSISGSAAWRNKADNCITVYRYMESNDVDIYVQKIRFKDVGEVGVVRLVYDKVTGRYK